MMTERSGAVALEPLRLARAAQRSAQYDAALELLDGCEDWDEARAERAALLKAETLGRRDPTQALEYLATVDDLFSTDEGRFGRDLEYGRLYAAVRDFGSAESRYADARRLAGRIEHGAATMAYHDLRMRWLRRECDPHAPEVALALAHPDRSIACAAYAYRAWLHAGNHDYRAHVDDLIRAVRYATADGDEPVDVSVLATSVHALAQVAFETADAAGIAAARTACDALAWTPDVQTHQFATMRAFGWDAFMRGNAGQAQWAFKEARAMAPTTIWRIMGHLDRAYVARMSGNEFWALEELAQADALAFEVPWESSFGEERQVLVTLAVLHAPGDAARAQRYATLYSRIGTENVNPVFAVNGDRRAQAHARYAQGRIEQTLGRRDAAVAALSEAFEIFESASFHYRAVLAATALAELTAEDRWRDAALRHAAHYPGCPLAAAAERSVTLESAMPAQLSPVQRQLARALWNGTDAAELSRRFSRSLFRIERMTEAVFAAFGVGSRGELYAEAHRRGLT
jgi:tetratricopeptide (TPR) repeat protein